LLNAPFATQRKLTNNHQNESTLLNLFSREWNATLWCSDTIFSLRE
jgi:hypothetical protein